MNSLLNLYAIRRVRTTNDRNGKTEKQKFKGSLMDCLGNLKHQSSCLLKHTQTKSIKFGLVVEYKKINNFLQKCCRNEVGRLVPDLFLFF